MRTIPRSVTAPDTLVCTRLGWDMLGIFERLRRVDDRFRLVFEHASVGMALTAESGRFLVVNSALCDMLGYAKGDLVGMHFGDVTHPDDRAVSVSNLQELVSGRISEARWEKRYLHRDGQVVWATLSVAVLRDARGEIRHMVAQMQDITDRREAQLALAASEHKWKQTFESAATGVALISVGDGRFVAANRAALDLLGYTEDELVALTIGDVTVAGERDKSRERFRSVISGEIPSSRARLRYVTKGGATRSAIVSTALLRDAGGQPLHLVAHVVDITDQVEAEEQLQRLIASKDELIASVSHELRTPLTAVVGYAQVLVDEASALSVAERSEMVQRIIAEGTDLSHIIDDLLVEARQEIGTLTVERVRVDLLSQARQVVEGLRLDDCRARIELIGPSAQALADPARVRQVVRNLVANACRYGGDSVRISCADGSLAGLRVADNGTGIPRVERDGVFEPYRRAHTREGLTTSLGLGLTISRKLARLMGGDLTYRREDGESVFELSLPRA